MSAEDTATRLEQIAEAIWTVQMGPNPHDGFSNATSDLYEAAKRLRRLAGLPEPVRAKEPSPDPWDRPDSSH